VAVLIHGGYWRARYDLRLQDTLVEDLARRGWAVWNLEYRRLGLRSRGGWPATFEDVAAGIDHLGRLDEPLDLSRVVVIGHSAGGHLALWAASRGGLPAGAPGAEPKVRPAAAVAQAGVVDLREAARLGLSRNAAASLLGGPPGRRPQRYDLASPVERLPIGVPQLLVHGDADDSVPIELSRRYGGRAREGGDPCDLVELPGCGHFEHLDPTSHAWGVVTEWLEQRWP
jgi:acetyl esterase/lipase